MATELAPPAVALLPSAVPFALEAIAPCPIADEPLPDALAP